MDKVLTNTLTETNTEVSGKEIARTVMAFTITTAPKKNTMENGYNNQLTRNIIK